MRADQQLWTGWGRTAPSRARGVPARSAPNVAAGSHWPAAGDRGSIARGLGRSYGDAAQCAGGQVMECTDTTGLVRLDLEAGEVTARAGTSFDALMRWLVPLGWFVPVTPGTRYVTVGGAVAADIHGKNHHRAGTFARHLRSVQLALPDGSTVTVGPDDDAELFWATTGGMGLTGVVTEATFSLEPIQTSRLLVDTRREADLEATMAVMEESDRLAPYSVAWIDLLAAGRALGRSVITRGRFARLDEVDDATGRDPLAFAPTIRVHAPPWVPPGLLNPLSVRAFNEAWFRRAPRRRDGELQDISTFFHPLDMIGGWTRLYGRRGFLQWQCLLPFGTEATLRAVITRLSEARCTSFLAVLKRFGAATPGPLSFPAPGWTLSLDIPAGQRDLGPLLDGLDRTVVEAGGRLYLAKDGRMQPELLEAMYPRLGEWRAVRARVDPHRALCSDLGRRLGLV